MQSQLSAVLGENKKLRTDNARLQKQLDYCQEEKQVIIQERDQHQQTCIATRSYLSKLESLRTTSVDQWHYIEPPPGVSDFDWNEEVRQWRQKVLIG